MTRSPSFVKALLYSSGHRPIHGFDSKAKVC